MNIISEKQRKTRLQDGIETILNLSEDEFYQVVEGLSDVTKMENLNFYYVTDPCYAIERIVKIGLEDPMETREYFGGKKISIFATMLCIDRFKDSIQDPIKKQRAETLLRTRDLESFKMLYAQGKRREKKLLDKLFEMLGDSEIFEKFLDDQHYQQLFAIEGENIPREEYLQYLGKFFGMKKDGNLENDNEISTNFYIPELDEYKERYSILFDRINIERYASPEYTFEFPWFNPECDRVIRKGEEPEWKVNEELYQVIYEKMPEGLSLEEKAVYIYCKMLETFSYDTGYCYKDYLEDGRYTHLFSKEHLEGIGPKTKITCWDFVRIFFKLINELEGNIEAVIISHGRNEGHFEAGFYTDRVSVEVEAINVQSNGLNDLTRAKRGIELEGLFIISDRENLMPRVIQKIYPLIFEKELMSIEDYLLQLRDLSQEEIPVDIGVKLQAFAETMRVNKISGNEVAPLLKLHQGSNFFGKKVEFVYLGQPQIVEGKKTFRRVVAIYPKEGEEGIYLLETDSLEVSKVMRGELKYKLQSGELVYEDSIHIIPEMNRGENE